MKGLLVILIVGVSLVFGQVGFIDLTHPLGNNAVRWPFTPQFNFSLVNRVVMNESVAMMGNRFQTAEHVGTHMGAPRHVCSNGKFVHEIPLERLSGPGVVIDLRSQADRNNDYRVTVQDIQRWESQNGLIPQGAVVLFNFGWSRYWPDPVQVFKSNDLSNTATYHFPTLGLEASRYLSGVRKVHAVGVDSPSIDKEIPVAVNLLCEHCVVILENVDNLDAMPATGSRVYIGAVKLENGSGAPVRLFAIVDTQSSLGLASRKEKLIDLTHSLGYSTLNFPNAPPFNFSNVMRRVIDNNIIIVGNQFQATEHSGTHVDAPRHFCKEGEFIHEVPLDRLSGPGVVIDLKSQAQTDPDYRVTVQDIQAWETTNGPIPEGAVVLFNFGWHRFWSDPEKFFNTTNLANATTYHFPGLRIEAANYLGYRRVRAVGIDTPTPDLRNTPVPLVHINLLCEYNILILENVDNLDAMPPSGSQVYIGAVKLQNGTGGAVRLFATIDCSLLPDFHWNREDNSQLSRDNNSQRNRGDTSQQFDILRRFMSFLSGALGLNA